jgi:hypothetical protein
MNLTREQKFKDEIVYFAMNNHLEAKTNAH